MIEVLSGEYTIQDYILANRLHLAKSKIWQIMRVVFIALFIFMLFLAAIMPKEGILWFWVAFSLFYILYPYTMLPLRAKIMFKQQKLAHGNIEIRFESTEIIEKTPLSEGSINWLHRHVITDKMVLLYTNPRMFIMLPRRFFRDDAQFNNIKDYLHNFPTGAKVGDEAHVTKQ